jgi:hypothetical protein
MTNSKTSSTADIPRGSQPVPREVGDAFQNLCEVCRANRVPMEAAMRHALAYKNMFHDMQDNWHEAQAEICRRGETIKRQREIIANLERQLGIDDEL